MDQKSKNVLRTYGFDILINRFEPLLHISKHMFLHAIR
jgi:hypothetical protein